MEDYWSSNTWFGKEYFSCELIVEDKDNVGTGAILRPVVVDGKIDDVIVINEGIGYVKHHDC